MSFSDQLLFNNDLESAKYRSKSFEALAKERYVISKHCNTPYDAVGEMTPTERRYLLQFIKEELQTQKDMIDKSMMNN